MKVLNPEDIEFIRTYGRTMSLNHLCKMMPSCELTTKEFYQVCRNQRDVFNAYQETVKNIKAKISHTLEELVESKDEKVQLQAISYLERTRFDVRTADSIANQEMQKETLETNQVMTVEYRMPSNGRSSTSIEEGPYSVVNNKENNDGD